MSISGGVVGEQNGLSADASRAANETTVAAPHERPNSGPPGGESGTAVNVQPAGGVGGSTSRLHTYDGTMIRVTGDSKSGVLRKTKRAEWAVEPGSRSGM